MIPLNLIFFIDSASVVSKSYIASILDYKSKLGNFSEIPNVCAYIKVDDVSKPLLPDIVDFLYDNNIQPLADDSKLQSNDLTLASDMVNIFSRDSIHIYPYSIVIKDNSRYTISLEKIGQAMHILSTSKDVLGISLFSGFPSFFNLNQNQLARAQAFSLSHSVVRTRDLWLASKLVVDNIATIGNIGYAAGLNTCYQLFSYSPNRFLAFTS